MATANELMERGRKLAEKYSEEELKCALKDALAVNDNEERLALQFALKTKAGTKDGYAFTKEQEEKMKQKLPI